MDKLKLAGWSLGQIFNFRRGRAFAPCTSFITEKLSNLKMKTQLKQRLGYLQSIVMPSSLSFMLP